MSSLTLVEARVNQIVRCCVGQAQIRRRIEVPPGEFAS